MSWSALIRQAHRWLSIVFTLAVIANFATMAFGEPPAYAEMLVQKREGGHRALRGMERHLAKRYFRVAGRYTVADIALYAYTHVADEGGISLQDYPAIRAWLHRVAAQPRHVPMLDE